MQLRSLLLMLALAGAALAQAGTVSGSVFDSRSDQPLAYANVVLNARADSSQVAGTVTGEDGRFRLGPVNPGRYFLVVSFVGYAPATVDSIELGPGAQLEVGRLEVEPTTLPVPGVEAVGTRPAVTFEADKKVIDVTRLPNASSGTAVDALQNVPGVKVDVEGNVTLRGSSAFTVLVDGRPTPLEGTEALKQIPSATIQNIEIITNPSAKYDPEGTAGIINVILKKQAMRGISALANADAGLRGRYNGDALVSFKTGILSTYAGGQLGHRLFRNTRQSVSRTFGASETLTVTTAGSGGWENQYGAGRAGLDLALGPRDKTSLSGRFGAFDGRSSGAGNVTERRTPGDSTREYGTEVGWLFNVQYWFALLDHEHQFDTAGHKLTGRAFWVNRDGRSAARSAEFDAGGDTTSGRRTEEPGPFRRVNAELEYELPLGSGKLEAGYEARLQRADQNYRLFHYNAAADSYEFDDRSSHPYAGSEDFHSLYATYSLNWGRFGIRPGLRGEYSTRLIEVLDTSVTWPSSKWDGFPSVHLSYSLPADQQLTASYSRRIERPDPWLLRPFPVWQDARNVNVGNPELRPEYVNSFEAGYELPFGQNMLSLEAYYRAKTDMSEWTSMKYPEDTTVMLSTIQNVGSDRDVGLDFSLNLSPVRFINGFLTGSASYYSEEGTAAGVPFSRDVFYWYGSLNLSLFLSTSTVVQLNGNVSGPSITAQSDDEPWFMASASARQFFFNRALSITLRCNNAFGPTTWNSRSSGPGFDGSSTFTSEGYVLSLALSYNFNNFRLDPKMRAGEGIEQQGGGGGGAGPGR